MNVLYIIIFGLILFSACISDPPHVKAAHQVMNTFTKKMKTEGLSLRGSGGAMMGDIQQISLGFGIVENRSVDEVRLLFIRETETLLDQVNINANIRPYLHDYPFTSKNIFFKITFCKPDGYFVDPPYIAYVSLMNNRDRIFYSTYNKDKNTLENCFDESYEEALNIYKETLSREFHTKNKS